ncbi:MAG: hypothetical protein A3F70_02935 [Acidobacteria bacterium RIFCSPLOWO2_12_FULL_67_14]|nr:MAG: hypothetical protein A3H29_19140 [Acidobacteria bacterium RIFCSPLOWO2_02_FULL_67_21]OFW37120.1 MAG: hypothetical protein A3F70_02935 [Acidobacteria bacterium RIFCSPLOWO2_12_FULL_67_14]
MFGLAFLSPLFLLGAAAAAIPIAIHLFYRRAEPVVEFAAMRYLRAAPVEQSSHRHLRELLLLALRVAAVALLACAFARPYLTGEAAALTGEATVVLVDTSASLSAPGQFDAVRERAGRAVREAPSGHAVAVLSFAHAADVVAPLSRDRAGALASIAALAPGAGATRFRAALERAAQELAGRPGRLVVVTDLQQSGWDAASGGAIPENATVAVEEVESPAANIALAALRIEGREAVAAVRNFSRQPVADQVVFTLDDRRVGAVPVVVPADGSTEARLPLPAAESGVVSASVDDRAGYGADNARYAVLDRSNAASVLAVTASGHPSEALYLERALAVAEGPARFQFRALSGATFSTLGPAEVEGVSAIVVLGTRGMEQRGRERLAQFVRSGGGLLVAAGPDVEPAVIRQALAGVAAVAWTSRSGGTLSLAPSDTRHPIFRLFGGGGALGNVSFERAALLEAPPEAVVLARFTDGTPALIEEGGHPGGAAGRFLLFGSDLNYRWNDFPLQPAFVPFVHEMLRYLASSRATRSEYLVGELPGEQGRIAGVAAIGAGPAARRVAVNVDPRESDPRRMTAESFQAGISRLRATAAQQARADERQQEDQQSLWRYGLLLMVVALAAEGLLGRRLG